MHTDARSAKKDVISTKPRKAMDVVRIRPKSTKKEAQPNLLAKGLSLSVAVIGARYPVQTGQARAGGTPPGWSDTGV